MQRDSGRHGHDLKAIARRVMVERDLLPDFSPAVMAEVARSQAATATGAPGTRDLRGLRWCSIDNDESRDLDQLTVAEPMSGGAVRILVAIADVDAAVAPGSATDGHARHNTTSVYTAATIFPMLPERLSTDLTSLGEGADRVALVVEMAVNADGTVGAADLSRAVVTNRAKLAYHAVAAWLDATGPIPDRVASVPGLEAQLRLQDQVAHRLSSRAISILRRGTARQHWAVGPGRPIEWMGQAVHAGPDVRFSPGRADIGPVGRYVPDRPPRAEGVHFGVRAAHNHCSGMR